VPTDVTVSTVTVSVSRLHKQDIIDIGKVPGNPSLLRIFPMIGLAKHNQRGLGVILERVFYASASAIASPTAMFFVASLHI
jgi:hypothetical protein